MKLGKIFQADNGTFRNANKLIASSISRLFCGRSPMTISWFVVTVVVFSFYLLTLLLEPHVSQKKFELHPLIANFYAASTIILIGVIIWIIAARLHGLPRSVFTGYFAANRMTMSGQLLAWQFSSIATATFDFPGNERTSEYDLGISAVATTNPASI
jgi:hypothetical protein